MERISVGAMPQESQHLNQSMPKRAVRDQKRLGYGVGDVLFWGTPTTAGEYIFIGHPKGDRADKVLVLAHSGEIGFKVDADECAPTDRSNPQRAESIASDISATTRAGWMAISDNSDVR
jgi:hypothetical protein